MHRKDKREYTYTRSVVVWLPAFTYGQFGSIVSPCHSLCLCLSFFCCITRTTTHGQSPAWAGWHTIAETLPAADTTLALRGPSAPLTASHPTFTSSPQPLPALPITVLPLPLFQPPFHPFFNAGSSGRRARPTMSSGMPPSLRWCIWARCMASCACTG